MLFLEPIGKDITYIELYRNETACGVVRLCKVEYPVNTGQGNFYLVQGRNFYCFYITNSQKKAERRYTNFLDVIEWTLDNRGYAKVQEYLRTYAVTNLGIWVELRRQK